MSKKWSYTLVGDPSAFEGTKTKKEPLLSGLWQWSQSFEKYGKSGKVRLVREVEDIDTDVLHINMTGGNFALPQMYRDALGNSSDIKLVINVDFDVSTWGYNWQYPTLLEKGLQCADMIFHVEPVGTALLEHVLKRKIYCLPHPVDVDGIDKIKKVDRRPYITNVFHRYFPNITIPYWAIRDLPMKKVLLGYTKGNVASLSLYDQTFGHEKFIDALEIMSESKFGLDLFHGYSYGRVPIEFAALSVPCVCSETIAAGHHCFPDLVVNPFDVKKANELFWKMINDDVFYIDVATKAYHAASYYSQKSCYERMVEALEEVDAGKG